MIKYYSILSMCILSLHAYAQFGTEQVISTTQSNPFALQVSDIDGDGDKDIVSGSEGDNVIAWYANLNGEGNFGSQNIITLEADGPRSIFVIDIDGDSDMDVLSASTRDDKLAWYENLNGLGAFGPQQIISTNGDGTISVFAIDLDGDGDIDVLSASHTDDKIAWYENVDGQGDFGSEQIISQDAGDPYYVYAADMDGDNDMDVLFAGFDGNKIAWHENTDGQGNFGPEQIISVNIMAGLCVLAKDMDGDEDNDVISGSVDGKVAWYENIDELGDFGPQQIITTTCNGAIAIHATDLDLDGDLDVLAACLEVDKITWHENIDGLGQFGDEQLISSNAQGASNVNAADVNGDGKIDVISESYGDNKIAWFENVMVLGVTHFTASNFVIHPNPATTTINIESQIPLAGTTTIVDVQGRIVKKIQALNVIDVSQLNSGMYFLKISSEGQAVVKKFIKE